MQAGEEFRGAEARLCPVLGVRYNSNSARRTEEPLSRSPPPEEANSSGRRILVLFTIALLQVSFNLTFIRPDTFGQTLTFAAFSALILVGLIALIFVLMRTLIKLYVERQTGVLGSKFRTKMVSGALLLSLGPVIALFFFSYGLMNRSIDKCFRVRWRRCVSTRPR